MKNQFLLFVCCLAFVFSGMAYPYTEKKSTKIPVKMKQERLDKKIILDKEKRAAFQKQMLLSKMQNPAKSQKSENWWEPDTIYQYYDYGDTTVEIRRSFTYEKANCTIDLWQENKGNQWGNYFKYTYTYDFQNNMTSKGSQIWEKAQWMDMEIYLYKYDTQNNMVEEIIREYYWHGYWRNALLTTYAYDLQNKLIEKQSLVWDKGEWLEKTRIIYTYNTQNNLSQERFNVWKKNQWENDMIATYSYDSQNRMAETLLRVYNDFWKDSIKLIFTYDVQKNTITHDYYWMYDQWEGCTTIVFSYDAQGNLISELLRDQSGSGQKYTYSYDKNNNATTGFFEYAKRYFLDGEYPELTVYYNNMQSKLATSECARFTATYIKPSELGVKESDLLTNSVKLYPNPVSHILHIETNNLTEFPEVKIYSIQGVLLMNVKENQIDISSLPSGIYIANINGMNRKIVKQ